MKSVFYWDTNLTQQKITSIVNNNESKNEKIIRKNGISFSLIKVYIIVPDNLKSLVKYRNHFYIYYPIKNSDFLQYKNFQVNNENNKYKICFTKKDIIEEVKFFLGIDENDSLYNFDLYNQNLGILKNNYSISKNGNIDNNIIYIKIKLNKENSKIRQSDDIFFIPQMMKYKVNKTKLIEYLAQNPRAKIFDINPSSIINNTIMSFGSNRKFITKRNHPNHRRKIAVKKNNKNPNLLTSYNSNKIDKNTNTDDLVLENNNLRNKKVFDKTFIENYQNSMINMKNNSCIRNINKPNNSRRNLSSLDYYFLKDRKFDRSKMSLINKYKLLRNLKKRDTFFNLKNSENISIKKKDTLSYQARNRFVKSLYKDNRYSANNNNKIKKHHIHLSQPNIIKSYFEAYSFNNININKLKLIK